MICFVELMHLVKVSLQCDLSKEYDMPKISSKKFKISQSNILDNLIFPSFASGGPFKIKNYSLRKILSFIK